MNTSKLDNPLDKSAACPLCQSAGVSLYCSQWERDYWSCENCRLVFLLPQFQVDEEQEQQRYQAHQNDPENNGYCAFLQQLIDPLAAKLVQGAKGLDFGCGPGPAISVLLKDQGFQVANYDPFFFPEQGLLEQQYDFITCSEVVEHFRSPQEGFSLLDSLLLPQGWLGIMTKLLCSDDAFYGWHYARDYTHVCFYRAETMEWVAKQFRWSMELLEQENVVLFQKG